MNKSIWGNGKRLHVRINRLLGTSLKRAARIVEWGLVRWPGQSWRTEPSCPAGAWTGRKPCG